MPVTVEQGATGQSATGSSTGAQARRRARRSDSVRNSSLVTEAAIELFGAHGMDVTLAQVAERAGVGKATVYRTYGSREDMVAAMLDHRLTWMQQRIEAALDGADPWYEFATMIREMLHRMRVDRLIRYVLVPGRPLAEFGALGERMSTALGLLFTELLESVKETGRVRDDVTASDTAVLMSGVAAALTGRGDFTEASWDRATDLVLAACGTYPPDL